MIADKQTALLLLRPKVTVLDYLTDELKNDRDVIMAAVECCSEENMSTDLASSIPMKFRDEEEIIKLLLEGDPSAFRYASDRLKANREMVMHAVSVWGSSLLHASPELQDDREIVLAAVNECGMALQWASDRLRSDEEVVAAATRNYTYAIKYATGQIKA